MVEFVMRRSGLLPSLALAMLMMFSPGLPGLERQPVFATQSLPPIAPALMAVTELQAGRNGHFVVSASVNGNTIDVLVDTGASAVAFSYEDAEHVGLRPNTLNFDVPVATANGMAKAARVTLRQIAIDAIRVENVEGLVLPQGALRGTLLGMSFLSKLRSFKVEDGTLILKN
jgi:aspartyl protease family protein